MRNKSPKVRELLWEIHRLRAIVLRADQLQRSLGQMGGGVGIVLGALREELKGEPCIAEVPRLDI
jgi:ADP-dependent phosphofructokinase/glucokinase